MKLNPERAELFSILNKKKLHGLAKLAFWACMVGPASSVLITGVRF